MHSQLWMRNNPKWPGTTNPRVSLPTETGFLEHAGRGRECVAGFDACTPSGSTTAQYLAACPEDEVRPADCGACVPAACLGACDPASEVCDTSGGGHGVCKPVTDCCRAATEALCTTCGGTWIASGSLIGHVRVSRDRCSPICRSPCAGTPSARDPAAAGGLFAPGAGRRLPGDLHAAPERFRQQAPASSAPSPVSSLPIGTYCIVATP